MGAAFETSSCNLCHSVTTEPIHMDQARVQSAVEAIGRAYDEILVRDRLCPVCTHLNLVAHLIGIGAGLHGESFLDQVSRWVTDLRRPAPPLH